MTKVVTGLRPGGRSAKIQEAVHQAVQALQTELEQNQITVPMIAQKAGVTPSTIYRRWGDIQQLFSDVALEKLSPDADPIDQGSYYRDLSVWIEQYFDEYSSEVGQLLLKNVMAEAPNARQCERLILDQLNVIQLRGQNRSEKTIDNQLIIERVMAPMIFKITFSNAQIQYDYVHNLLEKLFEEYQIYKL